MTHFCYECNKSYANKRSLASHKSKYHKILDKTSNSKKVLLSHPAFGNDIPKFKEDNKRLVTENLSNDSHSESSENMKDNTKTRKRSHSSDVSEDSDNDNNANVKRIKTKESNDDKFNDEMFSMMKCFQMIS